MGTVGCSLVGVLTVVVASMYADKVGTLLLCGGFGLGVYGWNNSWFSSHQAPDQSSAQSRQDQVLQKGGTSTQLQSGSPAAPTGPQAPQNARKLSDQKNKDT